jgi:hypothetical protein
MGTLCSCGFSLSSLRIRRLTLEINCCTYSSKPLPLPPRLKSILARSFTHPRSKHYLFCEITPRIIITVFGVVGNLRVAAKLATAAALPFACQAHCGRNVASAPFNNLSCAVNFTVTTTTSIGCRYWVKCCPSVVIAVMYVIIIQLAHCTATVGLSTIGDILVPPSW